VNRHSQHSTLDGIQSEMKVHE